MGVFKLDCSSEDFKKAEENGRQAFAQFGLGEGGACSGGGARVWRLFYGVMSSPVQVAPSNHVLVGSRVTLSVVSCEQRLLALCREVLREFGDTECEVEIPAGTKVAPSTEVCLWDCESAGLFPGGDEFANCRILYLVPPAQVESLLRSTPSAEGHVLLNPVTRPVPRGSLPSAATKAAATHSTQGSATAPGGKPICN